MIYAKVDVKLRDHERAHRAGAAMATWTWALLYAREQESDGFIPDVALRLSWVGEKQARRDADRLVEVGLWERDDRGGYRICRYESKNETAAAIAIRRAEARERMQAVRANKQRTSDERTPNSKGSDSGAVPGSGFVEEIQRVGVLEEGESTRGGADPLAPPPEWFAKVVDSLSTSQMVELRLAECWAAYCGHATDKGKRPNEKHAAYWLTTVMVPKRREELKADYRQRERDKRYADHTPKYEKPTAGETSKFSAALKQRLEAEAKKGAA